jgi:hypothetical protein
MLTSLVAGTRPTTYQKKVENMRRKTFIAVLAMLTVGVVAGPAWAQSNGGGASSDATGQAQAATNCVHVYSEVQADLVPGGGPKSQPVTFGGSTFTTGPTNCDHFWQVAGVVGNG